MKPLVMAGDVTASVPQRSDLRAATEFNSYSRPDPVTIAFSALQFEADPGMASLCSILKQYRRSIDRNRQHGDLAVIVEVAAAAAPVGLRRYRRPFDRHKLPFPVLEDRQRLKVARP